LAVASAVGPFPFVGEGTADPSAACCGPTFNGLALNKQNSDNFIQHFYSTFFSSLLFYHNWFNTLAHLGEGGNLVMPHFHSLVAQEHEKI